MFTLFLIGFDGLKEKYGTFSDRREAKKVGKAMKKAGKAKKYRVKKRASTKALRVMASCRSRGR